VNKTNNIHSDLGDPKMASTSFS